MNNKISRRSFLKGIGAVAATSALGSTVPLSAMAENDSIHWDYEADVVVIGAGGAGLPAALKAMEDGASVILVEAAFDVGGHAAVSGGNLHHGAGVEIQKKYGIVDSADLYYYDHTRGVPYVSKFNDREVVRAVANAMQESWDFFLKKGMIILDKAPTNHDYYRESIVGTEADSVARQTKADSSAWDNPYTGTSVAGVGVTRPLEKTLRDQGAKFLLNYHMDKIYREAPLAGRVLGIMASYTPHIMPGETEPLTSLFTEGNIETTQATVNIKANKGVIIATGGSIGNLNFRTMFDPRLGPEYDGLGGMPFSDQDGSGEIAAMEIGAALGSAAAYMQNSGGMLTTPSRFGCRYGYGGGFTEKSKVWKLVVANGIYPDFESTCIVNMLGQRCGNEDYYNTSKYTDMRFKFFDTALCSVVIDPKGDGNAEVYGGPLWSIFDSAAAERNDWKLEQGVVDYDNGYAFKADTIEELAAKIVNKYYEHIKMDPATLAETIKRYNAFVDAGKDEDWGKTSLTYKIEKGPFYALWATPSLHDTLAGLRTNGSMQVKDIYGNLIPGLFCAGESHGGMRVHGLGRVMTDGYIAGRSAASVDENGIATSSNALNPAYAGDETNHLTKTTTAKDVMFVGEEADDGVALAAATSSAGGAGRGMKFLGTSQKGINGPVQVEITVENNKMTAIHIANHSETEDIGGVALTELCKKALETQSAQVDSISGATITCDAFSEALSIAMEKAGIK